MKTITLHNGSTCEYEPADYRRIGEINCFVEFDGGIYMLTDERHDSGQYVRGNRHKLKLDGVSHWIGAHRVRMVGRLIFN